jgi:uncharacterized protein (TIGR00251 family)
MEVDDLYDARDDGSFVLSVHAQPGAGRTAIVGRHGTALKVKVAAPPTGGRANEALARLLAETFGVKPAAVELTSGQASRQKRFRVAGVERDDLRRLLEAALSAASPGHTRQA